MFRRVLIAYDGSSPSRAALKEALQLLQGQPCDLELAYVNPGLPLNVELAPASLLEASRLANEEAAERILAEGRREVMKAGAEAACKVLESEGRRVGEVLVDHAAKEHFGLIVIGSHGRRGMSRALLGSDAELVARLSPIPVLIFKASAASGR